METPLQIDLQGIDARPDIRAEIDKHVAQLKERCGRITAGPVVVNAPSGPHRTGGVYVNTIHLSLPVGREGNLGRPPRGREGAEWPSPHRWALRDHDSPLLA